MTKLIVLPISFLFVFFILISPDVAGYTVSISDVTENTSSNPLTTDAPSWFVDTFGGSCSVIINGRTTIAGSNFDYSGSYQSPGTTVVTTFSDSNQDAFTCRNFGTTGAITATGTNGTLEARQRTEHSGTSSFGQLINQLSCTPGGDFIEFRIDGDGLTTIDDKGFQPNLIVGRSTTSTLTASDVGINRTVCQDPSPPTGQVVYGLVAGTPSVGCFGNDNCAESLIFPFNSSEAGSINIKANITVLCEDGVPTAGSKDPGLVLVRRSTSSEEVLNDLPISVCIGTTFFNIDINKTGLVTNEVYDLHFFISKTFGSAGDSGSLSLHSANITIDARIPNFVCGDFGECLSGIQTRTCEDSTAQFPDKIEVQSCPTPSNFSEINLGFEDVNTTSVDVLECKKDAFDCTSSTTTILPVLELPLGWAINFETVNDSTVIRFHEAMAFLTTAEALEGQRSLELNYRPPKLDVVTEFGGGASPAVCDNSTTGFQGSLQTSNLTATVVSESFIFPGDFPAMRWATMKASTPRLQYDVDFFGANPFCSPKTLCYGDCNGSVSGTYSITLSEVDSSGSIIRTVFRFEGEATTNWGIVQVDLNGSNINSTGFHRIQISTFVVGEDLSSIIPKRLFFDDFRLQNLVLPLTVNCTSQCIERDLQQATLQNQTCFLITVINESSCVAIVETAEATALAEAQANNLAVLPIIASFLNASGLSETVIESSGLGFFFQFLSPFFISITILLLVGGFLEFKIAQAGKGGTNGTIFGIVLILGTVFLTLIGIFPIGFAIVFVIMSGFIVVWTILKGIRGG